MNLDRPLPPPLPYLWAAFLAILSASCGGSGSPVPAGQGDDEPFRLVAVSVESGQVLELNRPIELLFNREVAFSSVGPNTVAIRSSTGVPTG